MNFSEDKQKLLLDFILSNDILYNKVQRILKPIYFDTPLDTAVEFVLEYYNSYAALPDISIILAETGVEFVERELTEDKFQYMTDETESFCKNMAFRNAIMDSAEEIQENIFGNAQDRVREAMSISVDTDLGIDIFHNPAQRIALMEDSVEAIALGWKEWDRQTNLTKRGELNLISGNSGAGKSVMLANIADRISKQGLDVVVLSLELSAALVSKRFDAILTGVPIGHIMDDLNHIDAIYQRIESGYGKLLVKKMPVGSCANDIRSYLFEYQLINKKPPDCIIVDHMDLMAPNAGGKKDGAFDRDKQIAEETREIFIDYNSYGFSASQLNRDSIDVKHKSQAHIAGGISKINTSDIAGAISRTDEQIDAGFVELQFLKLRNATMKVTPVLLHWCDQTLRISDPVHGLSTGTQQAGTAALAGALTTKTQHVVDQKDDLAGMLNRMKR